MLHLNTLLFYSPMKLELGNVYDTFQTIIIIFFSRVGNIHFVEDVQFENPLTTTVCYG